MMYKIISINSNALSTSLSSNLSSEDQLLKEWVKAPYCETSKHLSARPSKSTDNPLQLRFEDNKAQILRFLKKLIVSLIRKSSGQKYWLTISIFNF